MTKVYVTKYALTRGITVEEGEVYGNGIFRVVEGRLLGPSFRQSEWHGDFCAALARAEEMRAKAITSHRKQIEKLSRIKFFVREKAVVSQFEPNHA